MTLNLEPFTVTVSDQEKKDLRSRLEATRWPEPETVQDWSQGAPLSYVQGLTEYWAHGYDLDRVADRLNAWPQFRTEVDGLGLHLLHARSRHEDAMPIVLTHGWPSSVVEFLDVLEALVDPPDPADAFHVVVPSLPGHGFSDRPATTGWTVTRIAQAWATLMAGLGYPRYGAHGGDWGSWVTGLLGAVDPEHLSGIHMTMPMASAPTEQVELSERDQRAMAKMRSFGSNRSAYAAVQSTRPQTFGYGLTDSPVGQLSWITERFWEWSGHDVPGGTGDFEKSIGRDVLLDVVMTYWLTSTAASAGRLFWESFQSTTLLPVDVPTGCSVFPNDAWMPRAWCEQRFSDIRHWRDLEAGGHFPAVETPGVLVDELRTFFRPLR